MTDATAKRKICAHEWRESSDWYGDPDVINGTVSFPIWECRKCGQREYEKPADFEELAL
jgi:hypothetical protein